MLAEWSTQRVATGKNGKTMRVLMIVENCAYMRDPRVRPEAKALTAAGHRVSVICPAENKQPWRDMIDNVSVYRFPVFPFPPGMLGHLVEYTYAMLAIAVITAFVLLLEGFDVIHVANPPDCIVLVICVYKLLGKLIIYDQHDLCPELYGARFGRTNRLLLGLLLLLERLSYGLADHIIVTNESYKEIAMKRGRVCESRVTVVRNGPDLRSLAVTGVDAELRSNSPNIIAFAGITGFQDGLDYLCRALYRLRYDLCREDFNCIVMGDGDALQHIKSLACELRLEGNISFAGWISDPDVYRRYLFTADICVVPEPSNAYNDRSTFVKLLEYLAVGKPIVAFDLPESRFSAQSAALYAHPNDEHEFALKIARLMDDPALRRSMGEIGRQRIQRELAWQYSVPNLLKVYNELIVPHSED
jgi:glycosyltransferase involved in cell wall biosynthesis